MTMHVLDGSGKIHPLPVPSPLGQLTIPGLELSDTGVTRTGAPVDCDAIVEVFARMPRLEAALSWTAGDLVLILAEETSLPAALVRIADLEPLSQEHLAKAVNVCQRIPQERRHPALTFSHHVEVAGCHPDTQARLLDLAEHERLSVRALRAVLRQEREDMAGEPLPGLARLPRPPETTLRAILERDENAWVLWQPATGTMRPAEVT